MTSYPALTGLSVTDPEASLAAMDAVRGYCGWHIAPAVEETLTVRASGSGILVLPTLHLTAVSVVEDGATLSVDAYNFTDYGALIRVNGYWLLDVTVTFTHGYDPCPAGVAAAVSAMARAGVRTSGSVRVGQVSVSNTAATADSFSDYLGQYRMSRVA